MSDDILSTWKEDAHAIFLIEPTQRMNEIIRKIGNRFYVTKEKSKADCYKTVVASKWKEEVLIYDSNTIFERNVKICLENNVMNDGSYQKIQYKI